MLLRFKTWSKSLRSRSCTRRAASRSNHVGRVESLELRELLSAVSVLPTGIGLTQPTMIAMGDAGTPPVGVNDEYTVVAGGTLVVPSPGVMGNDYDPDGGTIRSISIRSFPQHALTSSIGNSGLSYTAAPGFVGDDFWTYRPVDVTDATLTGNLTTVTIHVVAANLPPVAHDQSLVIDENSPVTITLTGSDPEGRPVQFEAFESAEHGALETTDDPFTWIYTPDPNYVGPDQFRFSVSDGAIESPLATISIQVHPATTPPAPIGVDDDQHDGGEQIVQTRAYATLLDSSDLAADAWGRVHDVAVIDTVAGSVLTTIHTVAPTSRTSQ